MAGRLTRSRMLPPRQQHEQQQQLRAKWTTPLTKVLVDLMVDQVYKGNRQRHSFSKRAWTLISNDFREKSGLGWGVEQLKNRFAVLRRHYSMVKLLLEQSDFRWDETTGTISAKDEVWERLIEDHPDAETVRTSGCSMYPQLCIIFSEPGTDGTNNGPIKLETPCPELTMFKEEPQSEPEDIADIDSEEDKFRTLVSSGPNGRKRGRKGVDDAIAEAILEMAAASKLRTAAMKQCNGRFSITNCVGVLDEMKGVDQKVYFAALDLFSSPYARETFLSLKTDKRFDWLCRKCSALSGP